MSTTAQLMHQTAAHFAPVMRDLPRWAGLAALLILFRPLLVGLLRAALLVVRPRLSRDELSRRAHMRDLQLVQQMIDASCGPSHASELRAMAGRD